MAGGRADLVGRLEEMAAVTEALAALTDADAGGVLQLAGEPGIGKTRLLDELRVTAERGGHLVLSGRAAEFEGELPFGVFVDAVDDHLAALAPDGLLHLAGRDGPLLSVAFSAFEPLAEGSPPVLTEERFRTHRAVRSLLSRLAGTQSVVLVLDDVHWADAASVELLSHLLTHPPLGPVLLVVAYRPAQLPGRLAAALAGRLRLPRGHRIDLEPLPPADAHALLGSAVSAPLADQLYRQSGGNPFYLQELARGAVRPVPSRPVGAAPDVPDAVRSILESEIGSLPVAAQILLQGASVAGDPFEEALAVVAAGIGADEAREGFDELLQAGLINLTATPRRLAFRHPIVRAAVYSSGRRGWVERAHGRVAGRMAERGDPASARAHHIERSAAEGDLEAVAVLTQAGDLVASHAPAAAARWYRAATRLVPQSIEACAQRISLLMSTAKALGSSGSPGEAAAALNEVLALLPPDEPARAQVVAHCAGMEHLLGRHAQARTRLLSAYQELFDVDGREGVSLAIELSASYAFESASDQVRLWARRALDANRRVGDPAMEAVAAALLTFGADGRRTPDDPELPTAVGLVAALDDAVLATRLDAALYLCFALVQFERYAEAIALSERATRVSRAAGEGAFLAGLLTGSTYSLMSTGRLAEAQALIDASTEASRLAPTIFLALATASGAIVAGWTGERDAALRLAQESMDLGRLQEPGAIRSWAGVALAVVLGDVGQYEQAEAAIDEMCGGPQLTNTVRIARVMACEALTRAHLAHGRLEQARAWADKAGAVTADGGLPVELAYASRARAFVLAADGDHSRAAEVAGTAADRADAAGSPMEAARCRIIAGRSLAHTGERDRAVALLEQAEEALTRCGAFAFRDQAEKELRRLGRRTIRRSGQLRHNGLLALTERERELADLVAQGCTNRQIAATAYLSEKTVERHLSHIYAKLGVSGRAGAAAVVVALTVGPTDRGPPG